MIEFLWSASSDEMKAAARDVFKSLDPNKTYRFEAVEHKPEREDRSKAMNRWFWAAVIPAACKGLANKFGGEWKPRDANAFLSSRFLSRQIRGLHAPNALAGMIVKHLSELDSPEFSAYIDNCRKYLIEECGEWVPDPEPKVPEPPVTNP